MTRERSLLHNIVKATHIMRHRSKGGAEVELGVKLYPGSDLEVLVFLGPTTFF